jgi:hypothetical protein
LAVDKQGLSLKFYQAGLGVCDAALVRGRKAMRLQREKL